VGEGAAQAGGGGGGEALLAHCPPKLPLYEQAGGAGFDAGSALFPGIGNVPNGPYLPAAPKSDQGGLLAGILLLVLRIVTSQQVDLDADLWWILKFRPLALVGIGGWLRLS